MAFRIIQLAGLLLCLTMITATSSVAQEFDCSVNLDYSSLSGTDFRSLDDLEVQIDEYINDQQWTGDRFEPQERIDCDMQIVILESPTQTDFEARLIVSSRRPIHGTVQASPVVRFSDSDWEFSYTQGQSLIHNLDQHDDLTSVIDFYMYVLLGYDYDTFSEGGGTPHFERARRIKERADAAGASGWSSVGGRDRESIVTDMLDPRFERLRRAYFMYHFHGLDRFLQDIDSARDATIEALQLIDDLYDDVSRRYVIDAFFSVKHSELTSLLQNAPQSSRAYELLNGLDPAHDYSSLIE